MTLLISLKQFSVDGNVSATDSHINILLEIHTIQNPSLSSVLYLYVVHDLFHEMLHSPFITQVHISDC